MKLSKNNSILYFKVEKTLENVFNIEENMYSRLKHGKNIGNRNSLWQKFQTYSNLKYDVHYSEI